ncbi:MAG: GrpB family protein [Solirubrobacterales bacterium]
MEIVAYDPAWPAAFAAERERLAPLLGDGVELHHFGSTSVPGLAAKPVIDVIALVDDFDAPIAALVERGGYQYPEAFNATLCDGLRTRPTRVSLLPGAPRRLSSH